MTAGEPVTVTESDPNHQRANPQAQPSPARPSHHQKQFLFSFSLFAVYSLFFSLLDSIDSVLNVLIAAGTLAIILFCLAGWLFPVVPCHQPHFVAALLFASISNFTFHYRSVVTIIHSNPLFSIHHISILYVKLSLDFDLWI